MVIARCEKCGQEYQLEPGEKPADFQCECGGELIDSKIPKEPEEHSNEPENTITCPHCGSENPEDSKLCKSCKRFIIPIKTSPTDKTSSSQPQNGKSKDGILETWNKQSTSIKAVSILGFCVVLIFLIVGITGMLNPSQTIVQTPATTTSNNTSTSQVQAGTVKLNSPEIKETPYFKQVYSPALGTTVSERDYNSYVFSGELVPSGNLSYLEIVIKYYSDSNQVLGRNTVWSMSSVKSGESYKLRSEENVTGGPKKADIMVFTSPNNNDDSKAIYKTTVIVKEI